MHTFIQYNSVFIANLGNFIKNLFYLIQNLSLKTSNFSDIWYCIV